jgi:co-chaperonin GroES (HSP10)
MKPNLIKTELAEFTAAEWTGENASGYEAIGDHVMVAPDRVGEQTSGGIYMAPEIIERHTLAAETGVLVAVGQQAFQYLSSGHKWGDENKPQVGDRIYMQRYSGQVLFGKDGKLYRVMASSCIAAIEKRASGAGAV